MNRYLIIISVALLMAHLLLSLFPFPYYLESSCLVLAEIAALIAMARNGKFIHTIYYKLFRFVVVLIVIGVLLKILHYTGANEVLLLSLLTAAGLYLFHFLLKKEKKLLDVLKMLTALVYFAHVSMAITHIIPTEVAYDLGFISHGFFWITFAVFVVTGLKKQNAVY